MAKDLVKDFFKRDLSDAELDRLQKGLASEEEALCFSSAAQRFHKALGAGVAAALLLKLAQAGKGGTSFFGGNGLLGLGAKAAMVKATVMAVGASVVVAGGFVTYQVYQGTLPAANEPVAPVLPLPSIPANPEPVERHGKQVAMRLELQVAAQVQAVITDAQGNVIRQLGSHRMEAGVHRLIWDGYTEEGQAPAPGRYQVLVRWNGKEAGKWVELRAAH